MELAIDLVAMYLRHSPVHFKKGALSRRVLEPLCTPLPTYRTAKTDVGIFRCNLQDFVQRQIWLWGNWEPYHTSYVRSHLKAGDGFVDVGANIGWFTVLAGSLGAKVVAFEPLPSIFAELQANATLRLRVHLARSTHRVLPDPAISCPDRTVRLAHHRWHSAELVGISIGPARLSMVSARRSLSGRIVLPGEAKLRCSGDRGRSPIETDRSPSSTTRSRGCFPVLRRSERMRTRMRTSRTCRQLRRRSSATRSLQMAPQSGLDRVRGIRSPSIGPRASS